MQIPLKWSVVSLNLKILLRADYEIKSSYAVTVTATDSGNLNTAQAFTVTVNDVNDAPTAITLSATTINENATGAMVGTLSTTDVDAGDSHTYSLSGTDADSFEVVGGELKLKDSVTADYETKSSYAVTVTATDSGNLTTAQAFTVTVNDVNEAPSAITLSATAINENAAGAMVGTLSTTDVDAGDSHTYSLSGTDADSFEVVGGELKLKDSASADYETKSSYAVTVTATDSGNLTTAQAFTVTVNDVNDAPTGIALSATAVNNNSTGVVVGTLSTTDVDAGDSHTYSLSGADASSFEIVSGELKLKDSVTADYETKSSYAVTVMATDSGNLTTAQAFTVTVNVAPTAIALTDSSVEENYIGSKVSDISVTDANSNDEFIYTLSGSDAASFEVVNAALRVKSGTWFDYETKNSYSVTVTATDQGGLAVEKTFTVAVNDVDFGNAYVNEHVSVYDATVSSNTSISGLQWVYNSPNEKSLRFKHDDDPNTPLVITYSLTGTDSVIADDYANGWDDEIIASRVNGSAQWEAIVDQAFAYWSDVSGITFNKVDDNAYMNGDLRINLYSDTSGDYGGWSYVPYYFLGDNNSSANDIWIRSQYDPSTGSEYGPHILLHEIGHSLGLAHTHHDYSPPMAQNTALWSTMAYIGSSVKLLKPYDGYNVSDRIFVEQPGINDIRAIQYLYGMTPNYNHGDTTYTWTGPVYTTIYDTGGTDTIDVSGYDDLNITLDLRPSTISYIGTAEVRAEIPTGTGSNDYIMENTGFPVGIAENTFIENVNAGSGNDTITCNTAVNAINCGAGDDTIEGIATGDTINAGDGDDNFSPTNTSFTLIDGGAGSDTLYLYHDYVASSSGPYSGYVDLRTFTDAQLTNIEKTDISADGVATSLILTKNAIDDLEGARWAIDNYPASDEHKIVYITASSVDKLFLFPWTGQGNGGWTYALSDSDYHYWTYTEGEGSSPAQTFFAWNKSAGNIVYDFTSGEEYQDNRSSWNDDWHNYSLILTEDNFAASTIAAEDNPLGSIASESFAENITLPETAPADSPPFTFSEEEVLSLLSEMIELNPSDLIDDESLLLANLSDEAPSTQSTENYSVEAAGQVENAFMADHYDDIINYEILVGVSELG